MPASDIERPLESAGTRPGSRPSVAALSASESGSLATALAAGLPCYRDESLHSGLPITVMIPAAAAAAAVPVCQRTSRAFKFSTAVTQAGMIRVRAGLP